MDRVVLGSEVGEWVFDAACLHRDSVFRVSRFMVGGEIPWRNIAESKTDVVEEVPFITWQHGYLLW